MCKGSDVYCDNTNDSFYYTEVQFHLLISRSLPTRTQYSKSRIFLSSEEILKKTETIYIDSFSSLDFVSLARNRYHFFVYPPGNRVCFLKFNSRAALVIYLVESESFT